MADKIVTAKLNNYTPGTIILQWLTYAFWGWIVVAIAYLASVITNYVLSGAWTTDTVEPVAYGIAATLILLPFSVVFDWIYSKSEHQDKHGIAGIVMIIHAVLFALVAIGALVSVAFSIVGLLLSTGDSNSSIAAIVVSVVLVVLYAQLVIRIIRPLLFAKFRLLFRILVGLIAVLALTWGIVGPVSQAVATKDDRAMRDGLINLSYGINQYVSTNNVLPANLHEVVDDRTIIDIFYPPVQSQTLINFIDKGQITYTPNTKPASSDSSVISSDGSATSKKFFYELCGEFTHGLKQRSSSSSLPYAVSGSTESSSSDYLSNINYDEINVGKNCYKLSTSYYKGI